MSQFNAEAETAPPEELGLQPVGQQRPPAVGSRPPASGRLSRWRFPRGTISAQAERRGKVN